MSEVEASELWQEMQVAKEGKENAYWEQEANDRNAISEKTNAQDLYVKETSQVLKRAKTQGWVDESQHPSLLNVLPLLLKERPIWHANEKELRAQKAVEKDIRTYLAEICEFYKTCQQELEVAEKIKRTHDAERNPLSAIEFQKQSLETTIRSLTQEIENIISRGDGDYTAELERLEFGRLSHLTDDDSVRRRDALKRSLASHEGEKHLERQARTGNGRNFISF